MGDNTRSPYCVIKMGIFFENINSMKFKRVAHHSFSLCKFIIIKVSMPSMVTSLLLCVSSLRQVSGIAYR